MSVGSNITHGKVNKCYTMKPLSASLWGKRDHPLTISPKFCGVFFYLFNFVTGFHTTVTSFPCSDVPFSENIFLELILCKKGYICGSWRCTWIRTCRRRMSRIPMRRNLPLRLSRERARTENSTSKWLRF